MKRALLLVALLVGCSDSSNDPASTADTASIDESDSGGDGGDTRDASVETLAADATDATDAACMLHKAYSSKNAACNNCAQERCCGAVNGCFDDPRCDDDYVNCILACALLPDDAGPDAGDATGGCLADCNTKYPAGRAEYDAAIGCVEAACKDECK